MTPFEGIVTLLGVIVTATASVLAARARLIKPRADSDPTRASPVTAEPAQTVTNEMLREAQDPGMAALGITQVWEQQINRIEARLERTEKALEVTEQALRRTEERVDELAEQNELLRRVLREVVVRMERLAEWYRAGSPGEPPDSLDLIIRDALDAIPDLREEDRADARPG